MGKTKEEFGKKIDDFGDLQVILRLLVFTRSIWPLAFFEQCQGIFANYTVKR